MNPLFRLTAVLLSPLCVVCAHATTPEHSPFPLSQDDESARGINSGGMLSPPDTPDPFTPDDWTFGLEIKRSFHPAYPEDATPRWFVRTEYGWSSSSSVAEIVTGDIDILGDSNVFCLTVGRYLKRDLFGWPLDLSLNGTVCLHPSNANQDDIYEFRPWIQLHWTSFPWNGSLRTKLSLGEGLSYVTDIPYAEQVRRDFRPSKRLLNYAELMIAFNLANLCNITRLSRILPDGTPDFLEDAWLTGALQHRSGGNGLFGYYTDSSGKKRAVTEGLNVFSVGVMAEF